MNRRTFGLTSAGALAMTTSGVSFAAPAGGHSRRGENVELSGWLAPARAGAGHYFVLGSSPFVSDPVAGEPADWPGHMTMVLPANVNAMRPGRVRLRGRLYRGGFRDAFTGRAARAVLVGATVV